MIIDHTWNGHALIDGENIHYIPANVSVDIWPKFGIVQAGVGDNWIPEKVLGVGESYSFATGDFEIIVTRRSANKGKILSLDAARQRRRKAP